MGSGRKRAFVESVSVTELADAAVHDFYFGAGRGLLGPEGRLVIGLSAKGHSESDGSHVQSFEACFKPLDVAYASREKVLDQNGYVAHRETRRLDHDDLQGNSSRDYLVSKASQIMGAITNRDNRLGCEVKSDKIYLGKFAGAASQSNSPASSVASPPVSARPGNGLLQMMLL